MDYEKKMQKHCYKQVWMCVAGLCKVWGLCPFCGPSGGVLWEGNIWEYNERFNDIFGVYELWNEWEKGILIKRQWMRL